MSYRHAITFLYGCVVLPSGSQLAFAALSPVYERAATTRQFTLLVPRCRRDLHRTPTHKYTVCRICSNGLKFLENPSIDLQQLPLGTHYLKGYPGSIVSVKNRRRICPSRPLVELHIQSPREAHVAGVTLWGLPSLVAEAHFLTRASGSTISLVSPPICATMTLIWSPEGGLPLW